MTFAVKQAVIADLPILLSMVETFHQLENINMPDSARTKAISNLLSDKTLGTIWLILSSSQVVGYLVLTFGYTSNKELNSSTPEQASMPVTNTC